MTMTFIYEWSGVKGRKGEIWKHMGGILLISPIIRALLSEQCACAVGPESTEANLIDTTIHRVETKTVEVGELDEGGISCFLTFYDMRMQSE